MLRENCIDSHCLSWHRRNPFLYSYRPMLCPNTKFWTTEEKRMKVKTWCRRGRMCMFSHTKEEQMYHPLIYKTQICRDYPENCFKPFCPFAHGLKQLKTPSHDLIQLIQGPEVIEYPNGASAQSTLGGGNGAGATTPDDRIYAEFAKVAKEREQLFKLLSKLRLAVEQQRDFHHLNDSEAHVISLRNNSLAVADLKDWHVTPLGLIAVKLNDL